MNVFMNVFALDRARSHATRRIRAPLGEPSLAGNQGKRPATASKNPPGRPRKRPRNQPPEDPPLSAQPPIPSLLADPPKPPTVSSPSAIVLITGANSGIVYAASKVIASASAKYHVIMADRSSEEGEAASSAIKAARIKGRTSSIQLDVTDESSIAAAVERVKREHGRLDVLVNSAGIYSQATTLKDQLESTFKINVIGAALVAEAFTPLLLESANPYLLHISSTLGSITVASDPHHFAYGLDARAYRMSKAALNMLMLQDAKVLGKKGVKVFAVYPGLVESNSRGQGDQARSAKEKAGDLEVSGQTIWEIIEGERDRDVGKLLHKDGIRPW